MALILNQFAEQVQALYVAYFGRAGEPDGFNYWLNQLQTGKMNFAEVAASFSQQPEAKAQHSFLANPNNAPEAFVDSLYMQLFNRSPDAEGRAYWLAQLQSASSSELKIGILIAQFISGASATNGDAAIIENKIEAGMLFTSSLEEAGVGGTTNGSTLDQKYLALARDVVDNDITSDPASVTIGQAEIENFFDTTPPSSGDGGGSTPLPPTTPTEYDLDLLVALGNPSTLSSIKIEGVPAGFILTSATEVDEGIWIVNPSQASAVTLQYTGAGNPPIAEYSLELVATLQGGATVTRSLEVQVGPTGTTFGNLIDGYIAGATVFADANMNGVLDAGEIHTTTLFDGSFALAGGSGPLVAFGGTDVLSGLEFKGTLTAPAGSTVVTPLTTLISALLPAGGNATQQQINEATQKVSEQLGLGSSINLLTFDPVAAISDNDPAGLNVLAAGIQVQTTIVQLSAATGASTLSVLQSLGSAISSSASPVDLTSASSIEALATSLNAGSNADEIAAVVATANKSIEAASNEGASALSEIGKASNIAQGDTADALTIARTSNDFTDVEDKRGDENSLATVIANTPLEQADLGVSGTEGPDTITGGTGSDTIHGLGGNDVLRGLQGNDVLYGDAGNDNLIGGAGFNHLYGGAGQDRVSYLDSLFAINLDLAAGTAVRNAENDRLYSVEIVRGSEFPDVLDATGFSSTSANAASLQASGNFSNTLEGGNGDDLIIGSGRTVVSYSSATAGVTVDFVAQTAYATSGNASIGIDTLVNIQWARGSDYADVFHGSDADNYIIGGAGNDAINAGNGFDTAAYSSLFIDTVTAGIYVEMANGIVTGNESVGIDTLRNVEGIRGTYYADTFDARGLGEAGALNQTGSGNFSSFEGMAGDDVVIGNGNVRVTYVQSTGRVVVDLTAQIAIGNESVGTDDLQGAGGIAVTNVRGSSFNDELIGSSASDFFDGWGGDDFIDGKGGYDSVDYRFNDLQTAGIDVKMALGIITSRSPSQDLSIGTDTLRNIEEVWGTRFDDLYDATGYGTGSPNTGGVNPTTFNSFEGGGGNDTVIGNDFTRVTYYNATSGITAVLNNGAGTVTTMNGLTEETDVLVSGIRYITGSNQDDTISLGDVFRATGRAGADTITLGNGRNQVEYTDRGDSIAGSRDVIIGFEAIPSATSDQIRLVGSLASELHNTVSFIGSSSFSNGAGQIRLAGNILQIDINGDSTADMQIEMVGLVGTLSTANFVFA